MDVTFALWMFPALLACLFLGFPVAFSLIGITLVWGVATFGDSVVAMMLAKVDDVASNYVIAAVPLFILWDRYLRGQALLPNFSGQFIFGLGVFPVAWRLVPFCYAWFSQLQPVLLAPQKQSSACWRSP